MSYPYQKTFTLMTRLRLSDSDVMELMQAYAEDTAAAEPDAVNAINSARYLAETFSVETYNG